MGYYFVIDEFVVFGGLYDVIQCYYLVKGVVIKDDQILMIGFFVVQYVINVKILIKMVMQCFMLQWIIGYDKVFFLLIFVIFVK